MNERTLATHPPHVAVIGTDILFDTGAVINALPLHAAGAFITEKTGKIAKTHRGVHSELASLTKDDRRIAKTITVVLVQAYRYKENEDYGVDPDEVVTIKNAEAAIAAASGFLDTIAAVLV